MHHPLSTQWSLQTPLSAEQFVSQVREDTGASLSRSGSGTLEWANLASAGGAGDSGLTPVLLSLTGVWNTWALRGMLVQ